MNQEKELTAKEFYNTAEYPKSFAKLINTGITVNYENVFEFAEIYAKEFAKAELEKVKEEIDKHVERTVQDTEYDQWDGGFRVCAIDMKLIIDKTLLDL